MSTTTPTPTKNSFNQKNISFIRNNFLSSWRFKLALLGQVPMNFLAGLKVVKLTEEECHVTVPFKWLNKNPFRSTFWAVLGMGAELASGAMVIMYTYKQKPSVALIVQGAKINFIKKAVGLTTFICKDGLKIKENIQRAKETGEVQEFECESLGYNAQGELIAEFQFAWSVKARS